MSSENEMTLPSPTGKDQQELHNAIEELEIIDLDELDFAGEADQAGAQHNDETW